MTTRRLAAAALALAAPAALAGPDIITGEISTSVHYGQIDGVHAYAFATTACNLGDAEINWFIDSPAHPVTIENLYRVHDGRLEQVGLSFAAHTVVPLQNNLCSTCTPAAGFQQLGAGCSNPNAASIMGAQAYLGSRSEINAATGAFPFPFDTAGEPLGDLINRRLQVPESLLTPGDEYFAEVQYVAADDAGAGAGLNNASSRAATLSPLLTFAATGDTHREIPAILAWAAGDPDVVVRTVDIPGDGRFHVAAKVVNQGDGTWRYHYAIHNLNSHLSAASLSVPVQVAQVYEPDFHAPLYHSGSPVDNQPWAFWVGNGSIAWFTDNHSPGADLSANAVRWGTMYTFSVTTESGPTESDVTVGLFRPGGPGSFTVQLPTPGWQFCSGADIALPYGQLDFSDVTAFLAAFAAGQPIADYAEPYGQFDFSDVAFFLTEFAEGCP